MSGIEDRPPDPKMGNLAGVSGMSRDLYNAAYKWIGHFRGGLASATIAGCAGFAAMSGSSIAAAVTMGRVALPEMKRFNYADSLATGSVAAGGTLGILIPPSTGMIIYAILTEQSPNRFSIRGRNGLTAPRRWPRFAIWSSLVYQPRQPVLR